MSFTGFINLDAIKLRSHLDSKFEIVSEVCEILMDDSLNDSDWEELSCLLTLINNLKIKSIRLAGKSLGVDLDPYPEGF